MTEKIIEKLNHGTKCLVGLITILVLITSVAVTYANMASSISRLEDDVDYHRSILRDHRDQLNEVRSDIRVIRLSQERILNALEDR